MNTKTTLLIGWIAMGLGAAGCSGGGRHAPAHRYSYDPQGAQIVVGSLHVPRTQHQMTLLDPATGELLVTGGITLNGVSDTAERLDGSSGQSQVVAATMTTPRRGHVAVANVTSQVVIFGGEDHKGVRLASIEIYDAQTDRFTARSETLLEPRVNAAFVVDGDRVIIAGGGARGADSLEIWSLSQVKRIGSFLNLAGTPREDVQLVQVEADLVFLYGGLSGQPNLWIDLAAGKATPAANTIHSGGTAVYAPFEPGAVLILGGFDESTKFQRGIQVVRKGQKATDRESASFGLFQDRVRPLAIGASEGIYVFGGHVYSPVSLVERISLTDAELYPDLFGAPIHMKAAYLGTDHVVTSGGEGPDGKPLALVNVLLPSDPDGDRIFNTTAAQQARSKQLDRDLAIAQQQLTRVKNDLVQANAALAKAQADLQREIALAQALQADIDKAKQDITRLNAQIQALQGQLPGLKSQVAQLQTQGQQSAAQLQQARSQVSSVQGQLSSAQSQLSSTRSQVSALNSQLNTANTNVKNLQTQVNTLTTQGAGSNTTGTSSAASSHGPATYLYRPSGPYYGPGSAPNVPYNMAYARDAQQRSWVAIVAHQGKTLVYVRDATKADRVPSHLIAKVTIPPK